MSKFTDIVWFEPAPKSPKDFVVVEKVIWEIGREGSGLELVIPQGQIFDVSVPRALEWLVDPRDRDIAAAAAVHDQLVAEDFDIAFASAEFRRALRARGKSRVFAFSLYAATLVWLGVVKPILERLNPLPPEKKA